MSVQRRVPMCAHAEARAGLWVSSSSALVFIALRYSLPSNLTPTLSARTGWAANSLCRKSTCLYILYHRGAQLFICVLESQTLVLMFVEQDFLPIEPSPQALCTKLQPHPHIFLRQGPASCRTPIM